MQPFPVSIDRYFFTRFCVVSNPDHTPEENGLINAQVESSLNISQPNEGGNIYIAEQRVKLTTDGNSSLPYSLDIECIGRSFSGRGKTATYSYRCCPQYFICSRSRCCFNCNSSATVGAILNWPCSSTTAQISIISRSCPAESQTESYCSSLKIQKNRLLN
jgi:hypothetical protein